MGKLDARWFEHWQRDRTEDLDARLIHARENFTGYCAFTNNCETFARYIYIGWPLPIQTLIAIALLGLIAKLLLTARRAWTAKGWPRLGESHAETKTARVIPRPADPA